MFSFSLRKHQENRNKGFTALEEGRREEALKCFKQAVEVTNEMVLRVIEVNSITLFLIIAFIQTYQ
jgi:hypothetical protein